MASAAIAAPAIPSNSFQSASKAFKEQTPYSQMGAIAHGAQKTSRLPRQKDLLPAPMHHSCIFYRNAMAYVKLRLRRVHRVAQHPDTGNADLHRVAGNQRTDSGGRSRGGRGSGPRGPHSRNPPGQKPSAREYQP